jgi:hypothetical protein
LKLKYGNLLNFLMTTFSNIGAACQLALLEIQANSLTGNQSPEAKWKSLAPAQAIATDRKKRESSKDGQFISNTKAAS